MVVVEKGRFALLLSGVVILVGALSFLKWAIVGKEMSRENLIEKELRILSYSTFVSSTGPAPELVREFKKRCRCKVEFVTAGDAGLLLERLKLTQERVQYDLVIGLDQFWAAKGLNEWEWQTPRVNEKGDIRFAPEIRNAALSQFVPFDYAPMTFIYRKDEITNPPKSLKDFLEPRFESSLSLQDPRSSSPGIQFLAWIRRTQGEDASDFLKSLKASIHSVSPSWALSYGLFKKRQSEFVFSYLTSLAYHLGMENDDSYAALSLSDGHPLQVEYAGIPKGCKNCDLAQDFLSFILEKDSQEIIASKNFMLPAVQGVPLPAAFERLPELKILSPSHEMPSLEMWDRAFE